MKKISKIIAFISLVSSSVFANNHFGNNLVACGLEFNPINLESTSLWKA